MWSFCNDDRRLLRKNVRTAPVIPLDDLKEKIKEFDEEYGGYGLICNITDNDPDELEQFKKDLNEVAVISEESYFEQFFILENGIPVFLFDLNHNDGPNCGIMVAVYWDGKQLRAYYPRYGNLYNVCDNKQFGYDLFVWNYYSLTGKPFQFNEKRPYYHLLEKKFPDLKKRIWSQQKISVEDIYELFNYFVENHEDSEDGDFYCFIFGDVSSKELLTGGDDNVYRRWNFDAMLEDINLAIRSV